MRYLLIFIVTLLSACSVNYSFTSTSAPTEAKSITIATFYNESSGGPPNFSQLFTEKTRDYFQQNTKLQITPSAGDLNLEGAIIGYNVSPVAPQASSGNTASGALEVASLNRLTVTIRAKYTNPFNEKDSFEQSFSNFLDFDASKSLSDVEDELLEEISDQIILKIFTRSFDNW